MKKLNEDVLRRLIVETLDEQTSVLVEGKKKKKLKEAEPVPQSSDDMKAAMEDPAAAEQSQAHAKTAAGIAANTMNPQVPPFDVAQFMEEFEGMGETIKTLLNKPTDANKDVASQLIDKLAKKLKESLPK